MSFWTDKLAGNQPSNTRPLASVRAWWTDETREVEAQPPAQPQPSVQVRVSRAQAPDDGSCPECDSANYMSPAKNIAPRCFDCGYPLLQSTSGMVVSKNTPHGGPVRQVLGTGFHGDQIVARGL